MASLQLVGRTNKGCSVHHVQSAAPQRNDSRGWPEANIHRKWLFLVIYIFWMPMHLPKSTSQPWNTRSFPTPHNPKKQKKNKQIKTTKKSDIQKPCMCHASKDYAYVSMDSQASWNASETPMLGKSINPGGSALEILCQRHPRGSKGSTTRREPFLTWWEGSERKEIYSESLKKDWEDVP